MLVGGHTWHTRRTLILLASLFMQRTRAAVQLVAAALTLVHPVVLRHRSCLQGIFADKRTTRELLRVGGLSLRFSCFALWFPSLPAARFSLRRMRAAPCVL